MRSEPRSQLNGQSIRLSKDGYVFFRSLCNIPDPLTLVYREPAIRFSLRSVIASVGFVAAYLALIVPNYAAFRLALTDRGFGIHAMSRQYFLTWLAVLVCTAVLLPLLVKLGLRIPCLFFMSAGAFAMILNYVLPAGMM